MMRSSLTVCPAFRDLSTFAVIAGVGLYQNPLRSPDILHLLIVVALSRTRGQSNLTKSALRGPIPRLGVTPGGRKLYH